MFHLGNAILRQGSEKLRELEELMAGTGLFTENMSLGLGDVLDVSDNEETEVPESGPFRAWKRKRQPRNLSRSTSVHFSTGGRSFAITKRSGTKKSLQPERFLLRGCIFPTCVVFVVGLYFLVRQTLQSQLCRLRALTLRDDFTVLEQTSRRSQELSFPTRR